MRHRTNIFASDQKVGQQMLNKQTNWDRIRIFCDDRHRGDLPRGETRITKDIRMGYRLYAKVKIAFSKVSDNRDKHGGDDLPKAAGVILTIGAMAAQRMCPKWVRRKRSLQKLKHKLTRDEARRIAANVAKLPGVVTEGIEPGDTNDTRSSARDIPTIPVRFNAGGAD
jgi:hypothetical protein